jgi:iron complex transport system ATP-binding protein
VQQNTTPDIHDSHGIPAIDLEDVDFRYGPIEVLRRVSVRIMQGEFVCFVGPNGAGKTTLLRVMTHFLPPAGGHARLFGRGASDISAKERARTVALVPQSEDMLFPLSVRAMVLMGRYPHVTGFGFERLEDYGKVDQAIARAGLDGFASRPVTALSGGEQHRVTIARALAQDTPVLLLDEPNAHLDIRHQMDLFDLLHRLNREQGRTIVCVTHDLNLAAQYASRVGILAQGRIVAFGAADAVLTQETIAEHFGVTMTVRNDVASGRTSIVAVRS